MSNRKELVEWTISPLHLNPCVNVVDYLSHLPMGEMADSTEPWMLSLKEANLVVGGVPGAGKSVFLNGLLAHLSVHPHVEIALIDPRDGVEARPWHERLSALVTEQEDSASLIKWILADCRSRYTRMKEAGIKNAWTQGFLGAEEPVRVLVIDEASYLFKTVETPEMRTLLDQMTEDLASLVSIGRAAGFVVIVATSTGLPTGLRDLVTHRVAFRCTKLVCARAILGDNFEPDDLVMSPTRITQEQRGQAITESETGELQRVQCARIDDAELDRVSGSAWSGNKWWIGGK